MKKLVMFLAALMICQSLQASELESAVRCFQNNNQDHNFEIFVKPEHLNFESVQVGLKMLVVESNGTRTNAKIESIHRAMLTINLQDGRVLEFNQMGGDKILLGSNFYTCSNPIGF